MGQEVGNGPAGYSGHGFSLRGEKGRYVLPASFRKAIAPTEDHPRTLCVLAHERWHCLSGFGLQRTEKFAEQIAREEENAIRLGEKFDRERREIDLWTFNEIPFDASGRFVLPDHLAELGGIEDAICFLGGGHNFTLWSPASLYAMDESWKNQQGICRQLERDSAVKGKRK